MIFKVTIATLKGEVREEAYAVTHRDPSHLIDILETEDIAVVETIDDAKLAEQDMLRVMYGPDDEG